MQWYFTSLLILLVLVGSSALVGHLLLVWLPPRMQPAARVFLGVPLGWAILTLTATLFGWLDHGYASCHCGSVTVALTAAGAWAGRKHLGRFLLSGDAWRLAAFCVVASLPVLTPLFRFGVFSLYNDTFIYDGQALWLQQHGFWETARTDGGHPVWGTVISMQVVPLRMGAAFLLGWVQAAFGMEWPHEVFPVVAAMDVICGSLGVGAMLLAACPGRRLEAWLAALTVAVTVNGFVFGAANGFLPQTCGLAFAAAAIGLRALEMGTHAERSGCASWRTGVPLGVCVAAAMHCYWELLPLLGPALACSYLAPWPGWRVGETWKKIWARVSPPTLTCLLLVNLEWDRAWRGIWYNIHDVVGTPVAWPAWHFPAHALGFKSSIWENAQWITGGPTFGFALKGCLVALSYLVLALGFSRRKHWRQRWLRLAQSRTRWHWQPLISSFVWLALSLLLFLYFRYLVPSPWHGQPVLIFPDGVGQSWSQYKLTIWSSCALIGLAVTLGTICALRTRSLLARPLLIAVLALWCGVGLGWNFRLAARRGEEVFKDMSLRHHPLRACLAIRQQVVASVPPEDWIYLDWPVDGQHDKLRELMTYLLFDRHLASDWSHSVFLMHYITPADAQHAMKDCRWVLHYRPPAESTEENAFSSTGGLTLEAIQP